MSIKNSLAKNIFANIEEQVLKVSKMYIQVNKIVNKIIKKKSCKKNIFARIS
jgi:hypothetical protein